MVHNKVTVVTVVFNNVRHIEATIQSVVNQTYPNIEYIIIDGGSTDGTVDLIKKYEDRLAYWVSEPDKGIYDAMNKGIDKATGSWMIFMNSGDRFTNEEVLTTVFSTPQQADILYGDAIMEYPSFQTIFKKNPLTSMWKRAPFCHQASFIKTNLLKEWKYDTQYKIGADHDFFFKAYIHNKTFHYINLPICFFDGREGATKQNIVLGIREMFNSTLKHKYTFSRWLYARLYLLYIRLVLLVKQIAGKRITLFLTRLAKEKKT